MDNLDDFYELAKLAPKGDYRAYSGFTRQLSRMNLTPAQHTEARRKLVEILEV